MILNAKNYWPFGIFLMIIGVVILIIWTVNFALSNPVQEENRFMQGYHNVNNNINEIQQAQEAFESKYTLVAPEENLVLGSNQIRIQIMEHSGNTYDSAKIEAFLTRPHTNRNDRPLNIISDANGDYLTDIFEIADKGRWTIRYRIQTDMGVTFYDQNLFAL